MKLHLPRFVRKKLQSSQAPSSPCHKPPSLKSSGSLQASDSNLAGFSSACSTSLSSSRKASSSDSTWSKGLVQAQKVSSMDEIVVLQETTGKVERQFASKSPPPNLNRELEEAFMRFDANHDGKISALELGSVLRSLGDNPTHEELLLMVREVDQDGDGFIDLQEFILLNAAASPETEDLHEAFLVFDADADGKISVEELHHVLSRLGETCTIEECGRMIRGVDTDGDGFVDFQEFCRMMSAQ